jgi:hypothetical protein
MFERKHSPSGSRSGLPLRSTLTVAVVGFALLLLGAGWAVAKSTGLIGQRVSTPVPSTRASGHLSQRISHPQKLAISERRYVPRLGRPSRNKLRLDATAPETSITAQPASPTTATSASFSFASSEPGSTFACQLDSGSWTPCSSPQTYSTVALGEHEFSVRATDAAGNVDPTPATQSWTVQEPPVQPVQAPTAQEPPVQPPLVQEPPVQPPPPPADTTAPQTLIDSGPVAETTDTTASFTFSASEPSSTFSCKLDAGDWSSCSSPVSYTALTVGEHTFSVSATDAAGNTDLTPASQSWNVQEPPVQPPPPPPPPADTTPPDTSIASGPSSATTATSASFSFSSSEAGSSFACKLDGGNWAACVSPQTYSGVTVGAHTFSVRATDAAGNTDPTPASQTWTVQEPPVQSPPTGCSSTVSSVTAAQTALASASPGQTVCLADGTYGSLSLTGSKASPGVTLQAVNPGSVTVGSVSASGSGYTVSHLISGSATCGQGAKNIVFEHMKIGGEASAYGSSSSAAGPCTWQYSEIGPQGGSGEKDSDRCWVNCVGLTWKDNLIHVANEDGNHNDGFQGYGNVHGLVFTGNRFVGGLGSQAFFLKDGTDTNITFSDNLIVNRGNNSNGNTANPFQVYELKPSPNDPFYTGYGLYMTHNTIWGNGNTSYLRDCDGLNYFIQRNVIDGLNDTQERDPASCVSSWISANVSDEQDYNVLSSNGNIRAHGAHDTSARPVFVSPTSQDSTGDWQLAPGSPGYFGGLPERAGITWDPTTRHYGP